MGATSTRRTPRKSPPARKSKTPSPSPSRRKSKSPSRSRSPSPAAEDDDDDGTLPIAIEEKGIDFVMDSLRDNQATIIISFIVGAMFGIFLEETRNVFDADWVAAFNTELASE